MSTDITPPTRCILHTLDATDLERAVDDPRLAHLLDAGWSVCAFTAVSSGPAQTPGLALVLAPPSRSKGRAGGSRWWLVAVAAAWAAPIALAALAGWLA